MKRFLILAAVLSLAACAVAPRLSAGALPAAQDRVKAVISDNFETGELDGWESYPYAQDIGYEPWTVPQKQPTHNGSQYALAKFQKPNDDVELYQGFVKRLEGFYSAPETRFKCAVFLMSDRRAQELELAVCLADGRKYTHVIPNAEAGRWLELDVPAGDFTLGGKPLGAGEPIQAITIRAFYPVVSHLLSYSICIDDFALNGERARRFVGVNPLSTTFELYGFSVLHKHFFYGDTIGLTVKAEPGRPVNAVTAEILDPAGKTIVAGVPLTAKGDHWTNDKIYTVKPTDPRGQWTIRLTGKSAGGNVDWGIRFLMPGKKLTPADHPRLAITAAELAQLKADGSEQAKARLGRLAGGRMSNVDIAKLNENVPATPPESLTGGPFAKDTSGDSQTGVPGQLANIALAGAQRYAFADDREAGQKAKQALLKLAAFTKWNTDWHESRGMHLYYPIASRVIARAAQAYDCLYPMLTEQERTAIREGIMKNAILPSYRDLVEQNRMPSSVTNHIAVMVTGLLKAATAIYGDDPENPCLEPYLSGFLAKTKQFIDRTYYPDGSYGEPTTYQDMATRDIVEALSLIETDFGVDYATTTNLKETWRYPLYVTYTNGRYPDFGDVSLTYNLRGNVFRWLSTNLKNPYARYYFPGGDEKDGVTPKSRTELVPSHLFPVKGHMVIRSGWGDDGMIMIFKAGPNSNHYHADQGTFQIMMNGEELLSDAGHGSSYYANLFYPCYYTQPIGHNCMLIDNDAESQLPADYLNGIKALSTWPRMLHSFAGWKAAEAEGDLTCVYKGKVQAYTRSFLYMNPDVLFMYDKVKSADPHTYSWVFHAENTNRESSIQSDASGFDIVRTKAGLSLDVVTPGIRTGRPRRSDREETYIMLNSAPQTKDAEFVAVLLPRATAEAPAVKPVSTRLAPEGWTGARVAQGGKVTTGLFRTGAAGQVTVEGFATDAERFAAVTQGENVSQFFLRGTSFGKPGLTLFGSVKPVAASVTYVGGGLDAETESDTPAEISLAVSKTPSNVTVNDQPMTATAKDGMIRLAVPAGHALVKVR